MLHWLWVILIGLVIGAIAKLVMPGKDPGGIIVTMLLGIAGSIGATWLGRVVGLYQEGQSAGFIMSVAGGGVFPPNLRSQGRGGAAQHCFSRKGRQGISHATEALSGGP